MERQETEKLLLIASSVYDIDVTRLGTVETWHSVIGHLDYARAADALRQTMAEHEYPTLRPADLMKRVRDIAAKGSPNAIDAWDMITSMRSNATERDAQEALKNYPAALTALRTIGGFRKLMTENLEKDRPFTQKRFFEVYEDTAKREQLTTRLLPGIATGTDSREAALRLIDDHLKVTEISGFTFILRGMKSEVFNSFEVSESKATLGFFAVGQAVGHITDIEYAPTNRIRDGKGETKSIVQLMHKWPEIVKGPLPPQGLVRVGKLLANVMTS
jgi:hypothetical protein